jgi:hypothetical protein
MLKQDKVAARLLSQPSERRCAAVASSHQLAVVVVITGVGDCLWSMIHPAGGLLPSMSSRLAVQRERCCEREERSARTTSLGSVLGDSRRRFSHQSSQFHATG